MSITRQNKKISGRSAWVTAVYFLRALCVILLTACNGKQAELTHYVKDTLAKPGGRVEPLPTIQPYEPHTYSAGKLRNPFAPISSNKVNGLRPNMNRPKEELEAYTLESLHMVGIILRGPVRWGLIAAPNQGIYRVRVGNYMGKNYGRVQRIDKDKILLLEIVADGKGGWMQRTAELKLVTKE